MFCKPSSVCGQPPGVFEVLRMFFDVPRLCFELLRVLFDVPKLLFDVLRVCFEVSRVFFEPCMLYKLCMLYRPSEGFIWLGHRRAL